MWPSLIVLLAAALITAAAAFWVLRAYRRGGGGAQSARPALAACALVAIAALGVYLVIGRPELPGAAYADRIEALKQRHPLTYSEDEALAMWTEASRHYPDDPAPYLYIGRILLRQDRAAEAARAYDAALRRAPQSAEAMLGLGRALVRIEGGVSPEALALFRQAGAASDDPTPWIYQALAAMQAGQEADAQRFWGEALQRMADDDPRREMARRMAAGEAAPQR